MPKPLATRQSVRVDGVNIGNGIVQAVRFVQKTVRGNPLTWIKTNGLPKILIRTGKDGEIFAHLPKQKASPIVTDAPSVKDAFLQAVAIAWNGGKPSKASAKAAVATKSVKPKTAAKPVKPVKEKEGHDPFQDDLVLATTSKAKKAATKPSPKKSPVPKKAAVTKTPAKKGGVEVGDDFEDDLSFPDA